MFKKFINMLFCKHDDLIFIRNVYGDEINQANGDRSIWKCKKCSKIVFEKKLYKKEK